MINVDFLTKNQNTILNELYDLTDGKIMLVGSSILKINGIIDRPVGNINLNLNEEDITYFERINDEYKMDYARTQDFGIKNKTYWFRKYGTVGVLFVSNHMEFDVHNIGGVELRVGTVSEIRNNKEELVNNGDINWLKHHNDVQLINNYFGKIKPKTLM